MSGANILDLLSSVEPNQITLAEDEFGDIYKDADSDIPDTSTTK